VKRAVNRGAPHFLTGGAGGREVGLLETRSWRTDREAKKKKTERKGKSIYIAIGTRQFWGKSNHQTVKRVTGDNWAEGGETDGIGYTHPGGNWENAYNQTQEKGGQVAVN